MSRATRRGPLQSVALACVGMLVHLPLQAEPPQAYYESEPNDKPAAANPIAGEVIVYGSMQGRDQDGFLWTVSDDDARKRWTFKLDGIPGKLTIAEIVRVEYAANGVDVAATSRLMKMGTRDGVTPSIARDLLFEPGDYLVGIAHGGGSGASAGGAFRPPLASLSFSDNGSPVTAGAASGAAAPQPGGYRFTITEGTALTVSKNPGPRELRKAAQSLRLGTEFATFETRANTWYAFSFNEQDARQRWDIRLQVPVGRNIEAVLYDAAGATLASARSDGRGHLAFADIAPQAATYYVALGAGQSQFIHVVASTIAGQRAAGEEAEPNGEWSLANRVDLSQPLTGRSSDTNEWDYYRFAVDETLADRMLTLRLQTEPAGQSLEFCLLAEDKDRVQCRRGSAPIELPDLLLNQGDWGLSVTRAAKGVSYRITLVDQGDVVPGSEAEPNDSLAYASGVPANNRTKGRFSADESDFFRFNMAEPAQLWRFQVIGDGVGEVAYYDGSGTQVANLRPARGERRVRLENVFLLPGQHFLRVSGKDGGSYTLLARPLGAPDRNGEREPNDDDSRMQPLAVGQTRTGLLPEPGDVDFYRFFLAHWDHVRLTIQPPADGVIDPLIYWYGAPLADATPGQPGEPVSLSGVFPPGDYHVALRPTRVSEVEYRLSLERLPRFACPADCEPNGVADLYLAAPLPPNRILAGRTGQWGDTDPYELPVFDEPTDVLIRSDEPVKRLLLGAHPSSGEALTFDSARGGYPATIPVGGPHRVIVDSRGDDYRLTLEFQDERHRAGAVEPLTIDLKLDLDHDTVAAYRRHGQRIPGTLALRNTSAQPVDLALDAVTSDYRWQVALRRDEVTLPANGRLTVPITIEVPADAWADRSVRISTRARNDTGAQAESWADVHVDRNVAPVQVTWGWTVPEALRGGFNAAWAPWGARLIAPIPNGDRYPLLFDGLVFAGARVECCGRATDWNSGSRPELTLDLPGEAPRPVAGIAVNHFGSPGPYRDLRRGTLLLSHDGVTFVEALRFETLPVETEQFFALDEPMMARAARLRLEETFNVRPGAGGVTLGEWKIILEPGHDLSDGAGVNLADPAFGGHLVSDSPPQPYSPNGVLDADPKWQTVRLNEGQNLEYVIGFHQNRAAQISRIEWVYAGDVRPAQKAATLDVFASIDASIGPWLPLGNVDITAAQTVLPIEKPVWARFVRIVASGGPRNARVAAPATIRIWERPTGGDYRSVLTEWGYGSGRAFYELQAGLAPDPELRPAKHQSRSTAAPIEIGQRAAGQVVLGQYEHWYRLRVPAGDNTLTLHLSGEPTVRTRIEVEREPGVLIPVRKLVRTSGFDRHEFEAVVEPGSDVFLRVYEPPRNVVFSWDTSASTIAHLPVIYNSLAAFASQVVPGQEAVNLAPFGRSTLLEDWHGEPYVLQTVLNDYPRSESSSAAERTLKRSAQVLAPLAGTKSIVVITDGITVHDGTLWSELATVQPRVFGVHVGGSEAWNQDVFEDWASVNGGHYTQLFYQGEMEVAFDRAATLMRRPADYSLDVTSEFREAPGPGQVRVVSTDREATAGGTAVELILDASGSMLQRMQGKRRIHVAKAVLTEAVSEHIPAGTPVALRVFGHKEPDACRSDLEIPLAPLDPAAATKAIDGIEAMNLARTPIADSLAAVATDLKGAKGRATIVLVTDGEETCDGDPAAVLQALQDKGIDVQLNIVGFALDQPELEAQFAEWAQLGGGRYFSARDEKGLRGALREALQVPFRVYDATGAIVAQGVVGGEPVQVPQGIYRIEASTSPPQVFERVEVQGEQLTRVTVE